MPRLLSLLSAALLTAPFLTAAPARAEVPKVVTDVAPVQSLAALVLGDLGTPGVLVGNGSDPHDYQLRPSQMGALSGADLVIWVGPELTPWLSTVVADAGGGDSLPLLSNQATPVRRFADGTPDPHAWLDPDIAAIWTGVIAEALAARDPDHAATYRANAAVAQARLKALTAEGQAILAPVKAPIAVGHDAFGYFAPRFGLTISGAIAEGDAHAPGAAHLTELRAELGRGTTTCLFPEAGADPRQAEQLVEGTPARLGQPLDPEALMIPRGADLYAALIRGLAAAIADCAAPKG